MEGERNFFLLGNRIESWNIVVFGKIFWRSCFALDVASDAFKVVKTGLFCGGEVRKVVNFRKNLQKIIQKA
jgi:hypothetical protein